MQIQDSPLSRKTLRAALVLVVVGSAMMAVAGVLAVTTGLRLWLFVAALLAVVVVTVVALVAVRLALHLRRRLAALTTQVRGAARRAVMVSEDSRALAARLDRAEKRLAESQEIADTLTHRLGAAEESQRALALRLATAEATATDLLALDVVVNELQFSFDELARRTGAEVKSLGSAVVALRRAVVGVQKGLADGAAGPAGGTLSDLDVRGRQALRLAFEASVLLEREPEQVLPRDQAEILFADYTAAGRFLEARPLVESFGLLEGQALRVLRPFFVFYRRAGYWELAAQVIRLVHAASGRETDLLVAEKIEDEIEVYSGVGSTWSALPGVQAYDPAGPILHMVGKVLPETQTGYTLRTHYTVAAQARQGLPVAIVGQSGIATSQPDAEMHYTYQGIDYHLLPGAPRSEMLLSEWLRHNIEELGLLVERLRPSVLHAQSDFFNAVIVQAVGERYGIPTVYESRGFWEESWLSRTTTAQGWGDSAPGLFQAYGLPDAYSLRRDAEQTVRRRADHVFTLAGTMRDHILARAEGRVSGDMVSLVPNAVESSHFPVQDADSALAATLGIPPGAVTVGYISSIVEYEGIDTLIDGFARAKSASSENLHLLIVGDGDYLATLREQVEVAGIEDVIFTGRVPHEDVLRYYGLIDIFVVPRKPAAVANLVTPLKPFEAFATGRAVVLSDVEALKEIASQCGAVETFRAGSADDLARVLLRLVEDPGHRRDLGERAARWVRHHRTWDANVDEYYRVYKKLGFSGAESPVLAAGVLFGRRGVTTADVVESLATGPLPSVKSWYPADISGQSADEVLRDGWSGSRFGNVDLTGDIDWARYSAEHRSWGFHLHAWDFMDVFLSGYDDTGDRQVLDEALRIAFDWLEKHKETDEADDEMAWYDMSLSLRTPRLLGLAMRAARVESLRDQAIVLAASLPLHMDELHRERAYNKGNNHGFFTAAAQAHVAKYATALPDADATGAEGRARLAEMAGLQFAADGAHLEHSPSYHLMLLSSFEHALQDGLIEDEETARRIRNAAHVLGWMIQPDRTLVQLGDTDQQTIEAESLNSIDPETQFLLSRGVAGAAPASELAVFPDGGYAFVRSPRPDGPETIERSGYLAFSASFHSRAHKHADDLNVVWFDRGQQILVDGGRFGYGSLLPADSPMRQEGFYYGAPERQYVEGTMAHNTLMLDGRNHDRRYREPYGSALGECSERRGTFDLSGRVTHGDYVHRRRVLYKPGAELLLKDSLFSRREGQREGVVWFNIDGSFELAHDGGGLQFVNPLSGVELTIESSGTLVEPVRGQTEPLRGWTSRRDGTMDPAWSVGFAFTFEERTIVETTLRIGEAG